MDNFIKDFFSPECDIYFPEFKVNEQCQENKCQCKNKSCSEKYKQPLSIKSFLDDFHNYSSFSMNEDGKYTAKIYIGDSADADLIDIEANKDEKTLKVSYGYSNKNVSYKSSIIETMPNDADYGTLNAVLEDGNLIITFERIQKKETNEPINIKIKGI